MPFCIPNLPFRKHPDPEYYHLTCSKCSFDKQYELVKDIVIVRNPECDHTHDPEPVEKLPAVCPRCGARLGKRKIQVKIFH